MIHWVVSFFTVLHLVMRGETIVSTIVSDQDYTYKHCITLKDGTHRCIVFRCKQHKHRVVYKRWFIPTYTYYTYGVEMISIDDDEFVDYHIAHYPHLCLKMLARTNFPYRCAVNAHLDVLSKHNSP